MSDVGDIESSSGDGGSDEDGGLSRPEGSKSHLSLPLSPVSVNRGRHESVVVEEVAEHVGHPLGLDEDESESSLLGSGGLSLGGDDIEKDRLLVGILDVLDSLSDVLRSGSDSSDHEEAEERKASQNDEMKRRESK